MFNTYFNYNKCILVGMTSVILLISCLSSQLCSAQNSVGFSFEKHGIHISIPDNGFEKIERILLYYPIYEGLSGKWDSLNIPISAKNIRVEHAAIYYKIQIHYADSFEEVEFIRENLSYPNTKNNKGLTWNDVPNQGFEELAGCIQKPGEISVATPWSSPTLATPDLFHACYTPTGIETWKMGVPDNFAGNTYGYDNSLGYAGIISYLYEENGVAYEGDYREYLKVPLNRSMTAGKKYLIGFSYKLSTNSAFSTDIAFSVMKNPEFYGTFGPYPSIAYHNFEIDTADYWQNLSDTLVAKGGENYLLIGNFHNYLNNVREIRNGVVVHSSLHGYSVACAYFLIDNIFVECVDYETLDMQSIVSSNAYVEYDSIDFEYSLGQIFNLTYSHDSLDITSGFHQPPDKFSIISDKKIIPSAFQENTPTVFPNPATDFIYVEYLAELAKPFLCDYNGRILLYPDAGSSAENGFWRFNTSKLSSGSYYINYCGKEIQYCLPIIKL